MMPPDEAGLSERCAWLEDYADLAYIVAHEFNDFLNSLLLHLSVLELRSEQQFGGTEIEALRRAGKDIATKVRQFQQRSWMHRPPLETVDLNAVVREVASAAKLGQAHEMKIALADHLPRIQATVVDLKRLLILLLESATGAAIRTDVQITVRTERTVACARLLVEDEGPSLAEDQLSAIFEPFAQVRPGDDGVKLAVCRAIVRRLQGNIQAENRSGGGTAVVCELRYAHSTLTTG